MFQIIGVMAEFERALIQERVRAGLRNARAKGKRLGWPRAAISEAQVADLRHSGASWRRLRRNWGLDWVRLSGSRDYEAFQTDMNGTDPLVLRFEG